MADNQGEGRTEVTPRDRVRELAEKFAADRLSATGVPGHRNELWAGHRHRVVRWYESRLRAFLAERDREALRLPDEVVEDPEWRDREQEALHWLYHGGDVDDLEPIRGTLTAMLQERATSENRAILEKYRAMGEVAGLREALEELGRDPCDACGLGDGRHSGICEVGKALAFSPLAKLAGEVLEAVEVARPHIGKMIEVKWSPKIRELLESLMALAKARDALRAELAKGGEDD